MKSKLTLTLTGTIVILIFLFVFLSREESKKDPNTLSENNQKKKNFSTNSSQNTDSNKSAPSTPEAPLNFSPPPFIQDITKLQNNPNNPSELPEVAILLDDLAISETKAIQHLDNLLNDFRRLANDGYLPGADNIEITNGLLGDNLKKIAFLSSSSTRINSDGELSDKWGKAYDFHLISLEDARIRSAGEDGEFYTEDDIVSNTDAPTETKLFDY